MKINYDVTIDEAVDLNMRLLRDSSTANKWKRQGLALAPIVFGLAYFISPLPIDAKLVAGAVASIAFVAWHLGTYKIWIKRRMRSFLIEQQGSDEPFPCEYELKDDGLVIQTMGTELKLLWSTFTEINETDRELELIAGKGRMAILPKRVFQTEQQKNEWLSHVRERTRIS